MKVLPVVDTVINEMTASDNELKKDNCNTRWWCLVMKHHNCEYVEVGLCPKSNQLPCGKDKKKKALQVKVVAS